MTISPSPGTFSTTDLREDQLRISFTLWHISLYIEVRATLFLGPPLFGAKPGFRLFLGRRDLSHVLTMLVTWRWVCPMPTRRNYVDGGRALGEIAVLYVYKLKQCRTNSILLTILYNIPRETTTKKISQRGTNLDSS